MTGVYAYLTYGILQANRGVVETMRVQILASVRPYVYFDLVPTGALIEGVVRNTGVTAAYDVTVSVDPKVQVHIRGSAQESSLIGKQISFMPPEKEVREFFGAFFELELTNPKLRYTGEVPYSDSERRKYFEKFVIDLSSRKDMPYIGRTTIEDELKAMNANISGLVRSLGK